MPFATAPDSYFGTSTTAPEPDDTTTTTTTTTSTSTATGGTASAPEQTSTSSSYWDTVNASDTGSSATTVEEDVQPQEDRIGRRKKLGTSPSRSERRFIGTERDVTRCIEFSYVTAPDTLVHNNLRVLGTGSASTSISPTQAGKSSERPPNSACSAPPPLMTRNPA